MAVFTTHPDAPRVLIANSNLVPHWANWEHFNELDRKGLMMYGQMTAGSWIYIGSQGIVQGTYETFAEAGRQHYGGDWGGKWILTAGLGGMGGAQPLAATMAGASMLAIECDPTRIDMRLRTRYLDARANTLDEAIAILENARTPVSVGLLGNAAEIVPQILKRAQGSRFRPALVTDQTSAHDPANGYLPERWTLERWRELRARDPDEVATSARESMAKHVRAILGFQAMGIPCVDYGNNIRQEAKDVGVTNAFDYPGFVPAYIRPLFCEGKGPFRWVALSGDPEDIYTTDRKILELFPHERVGAALARDGEGPDRVPGTAGADLLARPRRASPRGTGVQRDGGEGRAEGADRDRPRSPRRRLGREPEPRDRVDARRLGRGVRLAAPQRAAQHRRRRELGLLPSRRRRRDGLLAARRAW